MLHLYTLCNNNNNNKKKQKHKSTYVKISWQLLHFTFMANNGFGQKYNFKPMDFYTCPLLLLSTSVHSALYTLSCKFSFFFWWFVIKSNANSSEFHTIAQQLCILHALIVCRNVQKSKKKCWILSTLLMNVSTMLIQHPESKWFRSKTKQNKNLNN